jgi:hypothetical protein
MSIVPFMEVLPTLFSSFSLNSNSVGMMACLIGMAGGLYFSSRAQQLKAKKARIQRKEDSTRRD